jgi:hypothetical protein
MRQTALILLRDWQNEGAEASGGRPASPSYPALPTRTEGGRPQVLGGDPPPPAHAAPAAGWPWGPPAPAGNAGAWGNVEHHPTDNQDTATGRHPTGMQEARASGALLNSAHQELRQLTDELAQKSVAAETRLHAIMAQVTQVGQGGAATPPPDTLHGEGEQRYQAEAPDHDKLGGREQGRPHQGTFTPREAGESAPPERQRRSAAERRAQRWRSEARTADRLICAFGELAGNRRGHPSRLGVAVAAALSADVQDQGLSGRGRMSSDI